MCTSSTPAFVRPRKKQEIADTLDGVALGVPLCSFTHTAMEEEKKTDNIQLHTQIETANANIFIFLPIFITYFKFRLEKKKISVKQYTHIQRKTKMT